MTIKYNSNKKTTFNNYIDTAVSNLKKAETETSCILNFTFPSKTIIGRRFNKKSQISTLKGNISSAYGALSTVKADVQEQVGMYLKANSNATKEINSLNFHNLVLSRFNDKNSTKITKELGLLGYSYEQLDKMRGSEIDKLLGDNILNTPIIQKLRNPLKVADNETNNNPLLRRTANMPKLIFKVKNIFFIDKEDEYKTSVCQGGSYVNKNVMIYCDIHSDQEKGQLHVVVNKHEVYFNQECDIVASIDVDSHSNDITYIKKDGIILHPDHNNNKIDVYKLIKGKGEYDYKIVKVKELQGKNADAIAYDEVKDKIVAINANDAEVYSREDYLSGKQPESKFKVADQIKDTRKKNDCTYYNYRAGATAYDGVLYMAYNGFAEDKEEYVYKDVQKGNLVTATDYEQGGTPIGQIIDDIPQELESVDHNEEGDLIYFSNYGHKTRVFESEIDSTNVVQIAENYKNEHTMKAKTSKKKTK